MKQVFFTNKIWKFACYRWAAAGHR